MGFNYGKRKTEKEKEFEKIAEICQEEGIPENSIEEIHRLLIDELNSDRRYYTHTQPYDGLQFSDGEVADESNSPLLEKFLERFSATQCEISEWGRISWMEEIDSPEIVLWLKSLSGRDIEFLTLIIIDGMSQTEIAARWGCSNTSVSKRKKRIRSSLEAILPERLKKRYGI